MPNRMTGEQGAIAVLTAVLAFVLFGVSALVVDLGNMYTRAGDVQHAADLAALAGAAALVDQDDRRGPPSISDVARAQQAAHTTLVDNRVYSDGSGFGLPGSSNPAWTDGDSNNGEIAVSVGNMQVTVVVPPRTVRFGLAAIFGVGQSTVQARAVAEVRAPGQLLPFYLPDRDDCRTGPQFMTVPPAAPGPYQFSPGAEGSEPNVPLLNAETLTLDASNEVIITGQRFELAGMQVRFTLGGENETADGDDIDWVDIDDPSLNRLRVDVPWQVRHTPGEWAIRVSTIVGGWSAKEPHPVLSVPQSVINDCGENPAGDLALFTPNTGAPDLTANLVDGLSDELSVGDEVTIDPGLTVKDTTDGLLDRLAVPAALGCNDTRDVLGVTINNDKLSCFLYNPPGHGMSHTLNTLEADCFSTGSSPWPPPTTDLNDHPGPSLVPSIFDSPRFYFVPLLDTDVAPTGSDDAVEVREFRAVFLTSQTSGGPGQPDDTDTENGVSVGGSSIVRLQVFAFCPDELPNATNQGGNGFPWQPGLPTAIRLVE